MLPSQMVVKGKVGSIPVQFYCLSLHIKSIEIACGISDVWAGSIYWLSSKWSEQIWYELYNCFAVFEPRSPGLVSGFAIRLRHSPWANFEVDWRNPKNPLSPKWRKGIQAKVRINLYCVCISGIFIRLRCLYSVRQQ